MGRLLLLLWLLGFSAQLWAEADFHSFKIRHHIKGEVEATVNIEVRYQLGPLLGEPVIGANARFDLDPHIYVDNKYFPLGEIPEEVIKKISLYDLKIAIPLLEHVSGSNLYFDADMGALSHPGGDWSFNAPGSPQWERWLYMGNHDFMDKVMARSAFKNHMQWRKTMSWQLYERAYVVSLNANFNVLKAWVKQTARHPLTIVTEPPGAEIRLLNNKEGYYEGVPLTAGRYQIEVEKEGFKTLQTWIKLSPEKTRITLRLKALAAEDESLDAILEEVEAPENADPKEEKPATEDEDLDALLAEVEAPGEINAPATEATPDTEEGQKSLDELLDEVEPFHVAEEKRKAAEEKQRQTQALQLRDQALQKARASGYARTHRIKERCINLRLSRLKEHPNWHWEGTKEPSDFHLAVYLNGKLFTRFKSKKELSTVVHKLRLLPGENVIYYELANLPDRVSEYQRPRDNLGLWYSHWWTGSVENEGREGRYWSVYFITNDQADHVTTRQVHEFHPQYFVIGTPAEGQPVESASNCQ